MSTTGLESIWRNSLVDRLHVIDQARTVVHDYDRAGDYYSVWCVCGEKVANKLPHWEKNPPSHSGCRSTVEDALDRHRARMRGKRSMRAALLADIPKTWSFTSLSPDGTLEI